MVLETQFNRKTGAPTLRTIQLTPNARFSRVALAKNSTMITRFISNRIRSAQFFAISQVDALSL
jgi:hypothetical protein